MDRSRTGLLFFVLALVSHIFFTISQAFLSEDMQTIAQLLMLLFMSISFVVFKPWKIVNVKIKDLYKYHEMPVIRLVLCVSICFFLVLLRYLILKNVYKQGFYYLFVRNLSVDNVITSFCFAVIEELFYKGTALTLLKEKTNLNLFWIMSIIATVYAITWIPRPPIIVAYAFIVQMASLGAFILYPSFIPVIISNFLLFILSGS